LAYSYDGITWNPSVGLQYGNTGGFTGSAQLFTVVNDVAWSGSVWVVGGNGPYGQLGYSADGVNWVASTSTTFTGGQCNSVAWNGTVWVAGGNNSDKTRHLLYSYDGLVWTPVVVQPFTSGTTCSTVAWSGYIFLAGGQTSGLAGVLSSSRDGIIWTTLTPTPTSTNILSLASRGTEWMIGGATGSGQPIWNSTNTISWTQTIATASSDIISPCNTLAWNGSQWLAGGTKGSGDSASPILYYTQSTSRWTSSLFKPTSGTCNHIAWTGQRWIAGGTFAGNPIYYSLDGVNWLPSTNGNTVLSQCNALAARRVLPYIGTILGQPYYIGTPTDWYQSASGPSGPYSIPQALDLLARYVRQTVGTNVSLWPV
jgi:hypothetical protein